MYPGITSAEIGTAPPPVEAAEPGQWTYEFPDAHSADLGMIAVPGSDLIQFATDPVAIVANSEALGLPLPNTLEVLVVLDRAVTTFSDRAFFAFADDDATGSVSIRRFDDPPADRSILGKVVVIHLPFDPASASTSGTWLEEGDVSM
ncbi:hypothetical protein CTAYLR_006353 [Chrysophaeum taylorii]|uniref:Rubisco accumulation factor 1 C-terminal domain-containing protein n=1 Tax=Chrysophaeum taylorii TaxID=2483200 RepID=A0AAD7XK44_9STRA|nr:hypothetical protein CTAYLR_006353 [Chrysophaeum taylorii]